MLQYQDDSVTLYLDDCIDVLRSLPDASIDSCVTDPPYGIGFMGKEWDTFTPEQADAMRRRREATTTAWEERRKTNPNLAGRTTNGTISVSAIEYDYSLKGLRAFQTWNEEWAREVFRVLKPGAHVLVCGAPRAYHRMACGLEDAGFEIRDCLAWLFGQGFPKSLNLDGGLGTALKPAHEPIVLARKPFKQSVRKNVEQYGTGALNIDACRIEGLKPDELTDAGRWPANVCLDDLAAMVLDEQSGESISASGVQHYKRAETTGWIDRGGSFTPGREWSAHGFGDNGGASRFYYVAKPSRAERDFGCDDLRPRSGGEATDRKDGSAGVNNPRAGAGRTGGARNFHPTVKPVELMRWLVRLVTPVGGVCIDPFMGSGTTGMACRYEQRRFIGIEKEAEYIQIAERRIRAVTPLFADTVNTEPDGPTDTQGALFGD